jgi:hypothetical protein
MSLRSLRISGGVSAPNDLACRRSANNSAPRRRPIGPSGHVFAGMALVAPPRKVCAYIRAIDGCSIARDSACTQGAKPAMTASVPSALIAGKRQSRAGTASLRDMGRGECDIKDPNQRLAFHPAPQLGNQRTVDSGSARRQLIPGAVIGTKSEGGLWRSRIRSQSMLQHGRSP